MALLQPIANAAGFIEILGVAAKRSRDWREAGESEAGPVNKEARLAPETPALAAQPGKPPVVTPDDCGVSRRTSRSQYRIRYGQSLENDGVSVVLFAKLCVISAPTIIIYLLQKYDQKGSGSVVQKGSGSYFLSQKGSVTNFLM